MSLILPVQTVIENLINNLYNDAKIVLTGTTRLSDDLELDSLDRVELTMMIEEHFKIEFMDYESDKWQTIEDIALATEKKIDAGKFH